MMTTSFLGLILKPDIESHYYLILETPQNLAKLMKHSIKQLFSGFLMFIIMNKKMFSMMMNGKFFFFFKLKIEEVNLENLDLRISISFQL